MMRCRPAKEAIALQRCPVSSLFFPPFLLFSSRSRCLSGRCPDVSLASAAVEFLVGRKKELQGEITMCILDMTRD